MSLERYLIKYYKAHPDEKDDIEKDREHLEEFWHIIPNDLMKLIENDPICEYLLYDWDIHRWNQLTPEQKKVITYTNTLNSFDFMDGEMTGSIHVIRRFPSRNESFEEFVNEHLDEFPERYNLLINEEIIMYDEVLKLGGICYNPRCTDLVFFMDPRTFEENDKLARSCLRVPSYTPLPLECLEYWKKKYADDDNKIKLPKICHLILDFLIKAIQEEQVRFNDGFDPFNFPPMCRMYG